MTVLSVKNLIEAGTHYGHTTRRWHPAMKDNIFSAHKGIHIIDARVSLEKLKETYNFVSGIAAKGGKMLFVGTKMQARDVMREQATRCGCYYIVNRWLGGTLTNFSTIRQSITKLNNYDKLAGDDGTYPGILKKEAVKYEKLRKKMLINLAGIRTMRKQPAALFLIDIRFEDIAVKEAKILGIPVIAIVDTNANPNHVEYPIPGNDDSISSIELFSSVLASAFITGREIYDKHNEEEEERKKEKAEAALSAKAEAASSSNAPAKAEAAPVSKAPAKTEAAPVSDAPAKAEAAPVSDAPAKADTNQNETHDKSAGEANTALPGEATTDAT